MSDPSNLENAREATDRLFRWLAEDALPLWSTVGVDSDRGGFVEQLTPDGKIIADVRRGRLVARQIFAFASAGQLGWKGSVDWLVDHGLAALLARHLSPQMEVIPRYIPAEDRGEGTFDLYDQAFVLFGLAHGYAHTADEKLAATALAILGNMRSAWALRGGGFAEHQPPRAPLKANPHMHLLEASLAWIEASTNPNWANLASEMVQLSVTHFIDPATGALHEYFETDWSTIEGPDDVVEPGHQAEWAWLLGRWNVMKRTSGVEEATTRLVAIAEGAGRNRVQNLLINELNANLSPRDTRLRLWPQTERIKALVACYDRKPSAELGENIGAATNALLRYFQHPIAGSWWEHLDEHGDPMPEPARASSLYHIMGAANELARLTSLRLG
jgi:mannose/cellobiose epimerase-like protein (N-acyl-D-glucosamine 2-epimerase family)